MIKSRILPLFVFVCLLLSGELARAQLVTNTTALQRAGQEIGQQQKDLHIKLLALASQKKWPLIIHNIKGQKAYLEGVDPRGYPVYVTITDNIISAATIGTTQLWPGGSTGLNLNGSTAAMKGKIAVWDEGEVRPTHVELVGRVNQVDGYNILSDHSTHVAGTLIAAGVNPVAKGMANGAQQLLCYNFDNDVSQMFAASSNLLLSSHSYADIAGWYQNADAGNRWEFWGNAGDTVDYKFGYYNAETQLWDSIAYDAPYYLIVKAGGNNRNENGPAVGQDYFRYNSAGNMVDAGPRPSNISNNSGYNIIATYGCAKNIITIGAVNPIPGGYSQPSDVVLADFSSWGPTDDGRIKPDLVADGVNVLSSVSTADNAYDILSGTSMATPACAGSAFLLQEYYSRLHSGNYMRSATLKGILIHTADEAGPYPGPDYQYGWGLIDMKKAASVITSDTSVLRDQMILQNDLVNGSDDADSISVVASGKTPLTATISWTDPPAAPNLVNLFDTSSKLVNDLDLRVTDSLTGQVYMPWVLNPNNRPAAATTGDNFRDNAEKIEVDNLSPGRSYKIKVTHKRSLARGSQAYSLLVSGVGGTAYCTSGSGGAGGTRIDNVTLSNIDNNNSAGCKSYSDFTGIAAANLPVGQTIPISITYNSCTTATSTNIAVYIDFNDNGSFSDAGELVLQNSVLLSSGTGTAIFTGNITIPASAVPGNISRMRIIAEDNSVFATPPPCGVYANGETQDYRVLFTNPSNDVGVTQLEYPMITACADDSQLVAVLIHNFGNTVQTSVPVSTVITNGANTVATLSAVCKDTIAPGSEVIYTYGTTFPSVAGTSYTFTSTTALGGDLNTANDQNITTLTVSAAEAATSGTATICSDASGNAQVALKANSGGDDIPFWYTSASGGTPIAAGNNTTTSVIPSNKTYYLGLNDLSTNKSAPASALAINSGAGSYFGFAGNYINLTTSVPLTIESARLYIGNSGQITFTLATLANSSFANGYQYLPIYSTTINVAATVSNPRPGIVNVAAGANTDPGALYYLNIPVPVPGNYILIIDCEDNATAFLSQNNTALPYPYSLPGVISVTGTYIIDSNPGDSLTFPKEVYFPFYDMEVSVSGCASPRVAVEASSSAAPTILLNGDLLVSSVDSGNQWWLAGSPIAGATGQFDTAILTGPYKTVVSDGGCDLSSNTINFTASGSASGSTIGLVRFSNPNNGVFQLNFYATTQDNTAVTLTDMLGEKVYQAEYPDFIGQFSQTVNAGYLASGIYVLKILHGNDTYLQKILVVR